MTSKKRGGKFMVVENFLNFHIDNQQDEDKIKNNLQKDLTEG